MGRRSGGAGQGRAGRGVVAQQEDSIPSCVSTTFFLISTVSPGKQAEDTGCWEGLYGFSTAVVVMGGYSFR